MVYNEEIRRIFIGLDNGIILVCICKFDWYSWLKIFFKILNVYVFINEVKNRDGNNSL